MIRIRKASLTDYERIWQVHASDIDQWVDECGQVDLQVWQRTSMAERWLAGGPWMSPETCAIHLNALLLAGQTPLVASRGQKLLGEAELWLGQDRTLGGLTLNISVLYVHRQARGQGVGSALLTETLRRARVYDCSAVTVHNPSPQAEHLYRRFGLREEQLQSTLVISTRTELAGADLDLVPTSWPRAHRPLAELTLWAGSYQTSSQCWQQLAWAMQPGLYALPLKPIEEGMTLHCQSADNPAYLCLRPLGNGQQAELYIWSRHMDSDLVAAALPWARKFGIEQLQIAAGQETNNRLATRFGGQAIPGHKRLLLRMH